MLEDVGSNVSQRINDLHIAVIPSRVSRLRPIVRIHRTRAEGTKGLALKGFPRPPPSRPAATSYVRAEPAHTESKGMGARSKVDIMPFPVQSNRPSKALKATDSSDGPNEHVTLVIQHHVTESSHHLCHLTRRTRR